MKRFSCWNLDMMFISLICGGSIEGSIIMLISIRASIPCLGISELCLLIFILFALTHELFILCNKSLLYVIYFTLLCYMLVIKIEADYRSNYIKIKFKSHDQTWNIRIFKKLLLLWSMDRYTKSSHSSMITLEHNMPISYCFECQSELIWV